MPLTDAAFDTQARRLLEHYRAGEPLDRFGGWIGELDEAFSESELVNDAAFEAAVSKCIKTRTDHRLPLVAELRLYVEAEWLAYKREETKKLPPPTGRYLTRQEFGLERFAREVAIGRARMRRRIGLINDYRRSNGLPKHAPVPEDIWRGRDEPTDAEANAVLAEASA